MAKDKELEEMRAAVESAKETILQQNQHMGSQDNALRKAKQRGAEAIEDSRSQLHALQDENVEMRGLLDRCPAFAVSCGIGQALTALLECPAPLTFYLSRLSWEEQALCCLEPSRCATFN